MSLPKVIPQETIDLIEQYQSKYPQVRAHKLATIIIKEENLSVAHNTLRQYITHINSEKVITDRKFTLEEPSKFSLPESDYEEYIPYTVPKAYDNILILSDIHLPYHSKGALSAALNDGKRRNVNCIILNGDTMDFYQISRFIKDPSKRGVKYELEIARQFLSYLREMFPNALIIWKNGNHEDRWKNYLYLNAGDVAKELDFDPNKVSEFKLEERLGLSKLHIDFVDDKRLIKAGKLFIAHGHEIFSGSGAVNIARNFRLKANDNVIFGHFHRTQDDFARTISDKLIGSWAVGCLCGLSPLYMPINQWSNGFAVVQLSPDGSFEVDNKKILNGVIK